MPEAKSSQKGSHKLTKKENQISDMMLRGNKFLRRHDQPFQGESITYWI